MKYKWSKLEDYDELQEDNTPTEESDYSFIQEKIKDRPINRRRLAKRMLLTAGLAIIFGVVACISFLVLEPVLADFVSGKNDDDIILQPIRLPDIIDEEEGPLDVSIDDTLFEETPIEDMNFDDPEAVTSENTAYETVQIIKETYDYEISLEDYQLMYRKMSELSKVVSKSMVVVASVDRDVDILNESYENVAKTSGIIFAENAQELFIFADGTNISDEGEIQISFNNGSIYEAHLKRKDKDTNIAVYSIPLAGMDEYTKKSYEICTFGNSYTTTLLGSPVMAVGDPLAKNGSLCYGAITSMNTYINPVDTKYQIVTTDIFGSKNGHGFLFNVRGQVVGIITADHHNDEMGNMLYAYGFSSIRSMLEDFVNERQIPLVGLFVTDVEKDVRIVKNIPEGIFVTDVMEDSPAMNAGIVPGDIIKKINDIEIISVSDYLQVMKSVSAGETILVTVSRSNGEEYVDIACQVETVEK